MSVEGKDVPVRATSAAHLTALEDSTAYQGRSGYKASVMDGVMGRFGFAAFVHPGLAKPQITACYEITVDGEYPMVATAAAIMEAWADNAPQGVAKALYLRLEDIATICESPHVQARRIR